MSIMNIAQIEAVAQLTGSAAATENAFDPAVAMEFLKALDPSGLHNLVGIHPASGDVLGETFEASDSDGIARWILRYCATHNLYFSLNEPSWRKSHKLQKVDIGTIRCVYADLDPDVKGHLPLCGGDEEQAFESARKALWQIVTSRLPNAVAPTFVIDSGNGFQCIWKLDRKADAKAHIDWAERCGGNLAALFDSDSVKNIDRLFRLPGTLNYPTKTKLAKGLTKVRPARLLSGDPNRVFSVADLDHIIPPAPERMAGDRDLQDRRFKEAFEEIGSVSWGGSLDDVGAELCAKFAEACAADPLLPLLWDGDPVGLLKANDGDRSGSQYRAALAGRLGRQGNFTADEYAQLACAWPVVASSLDKAEREGGARRALARDWANLAAEKVGLINNVFESADDAPVSPVAVEPAPAATEPAADDRLLDIFGDDDPADLGSPPAGSLPPILERWARSEARRKGVPIAFAAISAITAVGAAIGSDLRIQVRQRDDTWTEGANLFSVIVADPGSAKSPTISAALSELRSVDSSWMKQDSVIHAEWAKASRRKGKDIPEPGPEPRIRRALVDDVTAEKMIRIFHDNPRGILRAPDELAGLIGSFGAYKSGGDGDRSHFLRSFDGGSVTYDRVGAGTIHADKAALSVLAGTQPDKMHGVVKNLGADGLLQRFIVVLHDGVDREAADEEPDRDALDRYNGMIRALLSAEYVFPTPVRMDAAAGELFERSWREMQKIKNLPGASPAFAGHIEKWGKILPRLLLIFFAVDQHERHGKVDPAQPIDVATAERAISFARFLLRHSTRFYRDYFDASNVYSEAKWIGGYLLTRPDLTAVRRRDIYDARKTLRGQENQKALLAAMAELEAASWLIVSERAADGPSAWQVNPTIHVRFAEHGARERRLRTLRQEKIIAAAEARKWINGDLPAAPASDHAQTSVFD